MRAREILSAAVLLAGVFAARPAAAQSDIGDTRVLATYDVSAGRRGPGTPARVTVADSGGVLVGSLWVVGDDAPRPVAVSVQGADVVLRGATPRGALELVLYRQNAGFSRQVSGRWTIGTARGPLRGTMRG
jgi:hypothetical protein